MEKEMNTKIVNPDIDHEVCCGCGWAIADREATFFKAVNEKGLFARYCESCYMGLREKFEMEKKMYNKTAVANTNTNISYVVCGECGAYIDEDEVRKNEYKYGNSICCPYCYSEKIGLNFLLDLIAQELAEEAEGDLDFQLKKDGRPLYEPDPEEFFYKPKRRGFKNLRKIRYGKI